LLPGLKHSYEDGDHVIIEKVDGMDVIEQSKD